MTWHLTLYNNFQQSNETCLRLGHKSRNCYLRSWFGPFAKQLYQNALNHCPNLNLSQINSKADQQIIIDKQLAQYILIQASFIHQRCLHQFHVNQDIQQKGLKFTDQMAELLLYIRMTRQHPNHMIIHQFIDSQLPWCDSLEQNLATLLEAKLIQQIKFNNQIFYDKNPYPHDHVLNLKDQTLIDYVGQPVFSDKHLLLLNESASCW